MSRQLATVKPAVALLMGVAVAAAFYGSVDVNANPAAQSAANQVANVEFREPLSVDVALGDAASAGVQVQELRHSMRVGDQIFVGGFAPEPALAAIDNARQYQRKFEDSINIAIRHAKDDVAYRSDPVALAARRALVTSLEGATPAASSLRTVAMRVQGPSSAIDRLRTSPRVRSVELLPGPAVSRTLDEAGPDSAEGTTLTTATHQGNPPRETWMPRQGDSHAYQYDPDERYVVQYIYWFDTSGFDAVSTYEHDYLACRFPAYQSPGVYCDQGVYLYDGSWPNGIPVVTYWNSILPSAYLDTRIADDPYDGVYYTIGSANADAIQSFTWYWSVMYTPNGNANVDRARLKGEIGIRNPDWCYTTWCIYQRDSAWVYGGDGDWPHLMPGSYYWYR